MRVLSLPRAAALAALVWCCASAVAEPFYRLESALTIKSPTLPNWDYLTFDGERGLLYIARRDDGILIYNGATANLVQGVPGTPGYIPTAPNDVPAILDGAKRDRALWVGDLNVSGRTLLDAFGSIGGSYVRGSLTVAGDYPATAASLFAPAVGVPQSPGPMPGFCPGP